MKYEASPLTLKIRPTPHALTVGSGVLSSVIPAEAGIQYFQEVLDPGLRQGDGILLKSTN